MQKHRKPATGSVKGDFNPRNVKVCKAMRLSQEQLCSVTFITYGFSLVLSPSSLTFIPSQMRCRTFGQKGMPRVFVFVLLVETLPPCSALSVSLYIFGFMTNFLSSVFGVPCVCAV